MTQKTQELPPIIISTPRSGLNWVRLCVEAVCDRRTPGATLLVERDKEHRAAFVRTHDPAGVLRKPDAGAWRIITQERATKSRLLLLLRDPAEIFGRSKRVGNPKRSLKLYCRNINYFLALKSELKGVFYYEEFAKNPKDMASIITFLDICPTLEMPDIVGKLSARWEELSALGRRLYDKNQASAGGSLTKDAPFDFRFHQSNLSCVDWAELTRLARAELAAEGAGLLERYSLGGKLGA